MPKQCWRWFLLFAVCCSFSCSAYAVTPQEKQRLDGALERFARLEGEIAENDRALVSIVQTVGLKLAQLIQRTSCQSQVSRADLQELNEIEQFIDRFQARISGADCAKIRSGTQIPGIGRVRYRSAGIAISSFPDPKNPGDKALNASVYFPPDPIRENCTVDFVFQFRGLNGIVPEANSHPQKNPVDRMERSGINAIIIAADGGDPGSNDTERHFGHQIYINNSIAKVLKKMPPGKCEGKLRAGNICLAAYSGGYGAVQRIMKYQIENESTVQNTANCFLFIDGMHFPVGEGSPEMAPILEIAKRAKDGAKTKDGRPYSLTVAHTAVIPDKGKPTTTQTANYLAQHTHIKHVPATLLNERNQQMTRKSVNRFNWSCASDIPFTKNPDLEPVQTVAEEGRLTIIQLNKKVPTAAGAVTAKHGQNGYVWGSAEEQHAFALQYLPCLYARSFCSLNEGISKELGEGP